MSLKEFKKDFKNCLLVLDNNFFVSEKMKNILLNISERERKIRSSFIYLYNNIIHILSILSIFIISNSITIVNLIYLICSIQEYF